MIQTLRIIFVTVLLMLILQACSGVSTMPSSLRAGETAVIAAGWKKNFNRENIQVDFTSSTGQKITYLPGDPGIRSVINLYPDPLSSLLISPEIERDLTPSARTYASSTSFFTSEDTDYWQTTVFVDIPTYISPGEATIEVSNAQGDTASSTVNILTGTGTPEPFEVELSGPLNRDQLSVMERLPHYEISFTANTIPYAIEVNLLYIAGTNVYGNPNIAYVANPRGDLKNINWNADGNSLKVLLTPTHNEYLSNMHEFKFYVAGGISSLTQSNILAVDENGNEISNVSMNIVVSQ